MTTRTPARRTDTGGSTARAMSAAVTQICPRFHRTIELVGKRWTGAIVQSLLEGPRRFAALRGAAPGLHDRLLSERLKELDAEGIVRRHVYAETPVRIEYALTERGRDLERVFAEIQRWADRWIPISPDGLAHRRAGRRSADAERGTPRRTS